MERRSVGRPRDGNPAETRREILRAAEESFAAAGFAGATTRQVAAKAGVNVATLHYHFGNKEGLYRAVLEEAISGKLPAPETAGAPADRLARLVSDLWDFSTVRPALARLSLFDRLAGPPSSGGPATGRAVEDPRVVLLARAIAEIRNGGPPATLSAGAAALFIVTLIDGAHVAAGEVASRGDVPEEAAALPREAVVAAALLTALGRTTGEAPSRR
jgi:AcrR family transcriptional regulator